MPVYLLKGGTIATYNKENEACSFTADVLIQDDVITHIGENLPVPDNAETINCTNKWITPGFVDTHR